jgi:hypothetical protein
VFFFLSVFAKGNFLADEGLVIVMEDWRKYKKLIYWTSNCARKIDFLRQSLENVSFKVSLLSDFLFF